MTPSQKPKWIEIDEKNNSLSPRKVSRTLPIIALAVTVSIIGIGSIYAHPTVESPASVLEITAPEEFDTSEILFDPTATSTVASIEIPLIDTSLTFGEEDDELFGDDEGDDDDLDDSDEDEDDESDEDEDDEIDHDEGDDD